MNVKKTKSEFEVPPPVNEAGQHGVYPETNHDERARLNFISACNRVIASTLSPGNELAYTNRVLPKFEAEKGRAPTSRHEVRRAMNADPFHNIWGAVRRNLMEIRQQAGAALVLRQHEELAQRAKSFNESDDNLLLNPGVIIPPYVAKVDHHCMPGSYYRELVDGDVSSGANYDTGFYVTTGGTVGPLNDGAGRAIVAWTKQNAPHLSPKRILDVGVAVGHSLLPIAQAYPKAEVIAIDVAAPMLRYAHARAKSLGIRNIKFMQMSGEDLSVFEDESFDWVQTSIFLHELSAKSLPKILSECYRVLKPGGITLHLEQPQYDDKMPVFEQFMRDWDAYNNNEPFWTAMHAINMTQALIDSGFGEDDIFHAAMRAMFDSKSESQANPDQDYGRAPAWHSYGAFKNSSATNRRTNP